MPASLTFDAYGNGLGDAWAVLRDNAARAGLDATVPSCPGWRVRDLVAHQGMVHRWATAAVRAEGTAWEDLDTEALVAEGLASRDPLGWLDDGARDLLAALALAPERPDIPFFLEDAAPGKAAWARRQCHETTVHAVDAMSAALGRLPQAAEIWVRRDLAEDGVDELLRGFVPRRRGRLRSDEAYSVVVRSSDTTGAWTMRVSAAPVVTTVGADRPAEPTGRVVEVTGTALSLYLALWNRGDEVEVSDPAFLDAWRRSVAVAW
jgi:uncharacterized protein (TIGR03083 family)